MTNVYKLMSVLLVFVTSVIFYSCENNVNEPAQQKTGVQFKFQKGSHNFYGKGWWKKNSDELKKRISINARENLSKANTEFDEVKILCLDMTRWNSFDEFVEAWESTGQYSLFDTTLWNFNRDTWDNIVLTLKSYTGDYYGFVGELNLSIEDSLAKGTINLNAGLNYFVYCLRENGRTIFMDEIKAHIVEGEDNVVRVGSANINTAPDIPNTPYPSDGATGVSTSTTLNWECSDPDGDSLTYYIYLSTSPDPSIYGVSYNNSYSVSYLEPNTTYYWKIYVYDSEYNTAESQVWSFTTGASSNTPAIPSLSSPSNGATNQSTSLSLYWTANTLVSISSFTLQVSTSSSFSSYVYNQDVSSSTYNQQVSGLDNNTTYYWRVRASNSYGSSDWSTVWSFTTGSTIASGWIKQTSPTSEHLYSVCFPVSTTGYAVGSSGTIINTTNGGINWSIQSSGTTNTLLGVNFISSNTGWAVGYSGTILKTTNAGSTWVAQTSGTTNDLYSVCFTSSSVGYVGGYGGILLKTTDGGSTWINQTSPTTSNLWSVFFPSSTTGWAVGSYGTILKTTDSGSTWVVQTSNTSVLLNSVCFISTATGIAVGSYGIVVKTTDGGTNWESQTTGTSSSLYWTHFVQSTLTGWAVGSSGLILKTTDGGTNWSTQTSGVTYSLYSTYAVSSSTCYAVGSNGTIVYTTSGGD